MLNKYARALFGRIFTPVARALVRAGISPDVVTIVGTLGVMAGALLLFPQGEFFWGTIVITAFVFSDIVDGLMARMTERSSTWGAYLDSTLDRFGDAAVFGGLAMWFAGGGNNDLLCALALYNLGAGSIVSYAKARAEGLGMTANVGIAERSDRLALILVATGFQGIGVPGVQRAALIILAVASTITLFQRILMVRKQALAAEQASDSSASDAGAA
ncbi:phosphatidylinositol phosphate synthase [Sporichthya sp.]|uniref:phosphatidylinositol phosphate synthase n=1 Tax=Sporichthya sp. TaxID=65475 RepID=UPI001836BEAD|nr:CDP-alcohol phosphatidyltransferase family protein [Sporichthya sp.]MBA3741910.1 CDP-alcohol phosphatidyltransferase family protein [Sporichthya sp.]